MAWETTPLLSLRIKLSRSDAKFVEGLLEEWQDRQLIDTATHEQLLGSIDAQEPFDWNRLAKYAFRLALVCLFIAVFNLLVDARFLEFISRILELNAYVRSALTAAIAYSIHHYAYKRSQSHPLEVWTNEAIHANGAIVLSLAALQLAEAIGGLVFERDVFNLKARMVLLLLGFLYLITSFATGSILIWSCGMFIFGMWTLYWTPTSQFTYPWKSWWPLRFVILGSTLISLACCLPMHPRTAPFWSSTRTWGLMYLLSFGLLWGSVTHLTEGYWHSRRIWPALSWALGLTLTSGVTLWHGLKYDDAITRGLGLVFMFLNILTRYYDFFWHSIYRPLFFAILAAFLALIGWGAERMWKARRGL